MENADICAKNSETGSLTSRWESVKPSWSAAPLLQSRSCRRGSRRELRGGILRLSEATCGGSQVCLDASALRKLRLSVTRPSAHRFIRGLIITPPASTSPPFESSAVQEGPKNALNENVGANRDTQKPCDIMFGDTKETLFISRNYVSRIFQPMSCNKGRNVNVPVEFCK